MAIGDQIKTLRKKTGYTQKQLAKECGMAEITIRQYESGKRQPRLEQLHKIAAALGVYISALVDDWDMFSNEELIEDLSYYGGGFYGKKAPKEIQDKFAEHLFSPKAEICQKMDLLNEIGQNKAIEQVELLTKIPEYQEKNQKEK